jgi:hypothetical protein
LDGGVSWSSATVPLRVVSEQLVSSLGIRQVGFVQKAGAPVIIDAQIT